MRWTQYLIDRSKEKSRRQLHAVKSDLRVLRSKHKQMSAEYADDKNELAMIRNQLAMSTAENEVLRMQITTLVKQIQLQQELLEAETAIQAARKVAALDQTTRLQS